MEKHGNSISGAFKRFHSNQFLCHSGSPLELLRDQIWLWSSQNSDSMNFNDLENFADLMLTLLGEDLEPVFSTQSAAVNQWDAKVHQNCDMVQQFQPFALLVSNYRPHPLALLVPADKSFAVATGGRPAGAICAGRFGTHRWPRAGRDGPINQRPGAMPTGTAVVVSGLSKFIKLIAAKLLPECVR